MHYKQMSELYSAIRRFVEDSGYDVSLSLSGLQNQMAESGRVGKVEMKRFQKYLEEFGDKVFSTTHEMVDSVAKNAFKWHRRFSISEIQCHRRCKLQHALKYVERLQPMEEESRYLRIGSWVHKLIEQLYSVGYEASPLDVMMLVDGVKQEAYEIIERCETQDQKELVRIDCAIAEGAINAYYNTVFQEEQGRGFSMSKENVEKSFTVPIVSDKTGRKSTRYAFKGRIDGIFDCSDGKKYIHEIKTKAGYGESDKEHLTLDDQVTAYVWAMRQLGVDVGGVVYTVIKKPSSVRRKTFEYSVVNNDHKISEWGFKTKPEYEKFIKEKTAKFTDEHYEIRLIEAELKKNNTFSVFEDGEEIAKDIRLKSEAQALVAEKVKPFIEGFEVTAVEGIETVEDYCSRIIQDYADRPEFYVFRDLVFREQKALDLFAKRIGMEVKEVAANNTKTAYPQPAEPYQNYCSMCDYRDLCIFWHDPNMVEEIKKTKYMTQEQMFVAEELEAKKEKTEDEIDF